MKGHDAGAEVEFLSDRYGRPLDLAHTLPDTSFRPVSTRREAEVAMAIRRPNGKILLQTKTNYPGGVFRIPTGGLKRGEAIERALLRETQEETALDVDIREFIAVLSYRSKSKEVVFKSYLFLLDETGGTLQEEDPEEGITGWIEADTAELRSTAQQLRTGPKSWRNWGDFRALVIDALLPALQ
ncbi:MAG: NUDIX hydrolase [Candidatus Binatia bacterium]|nr:NUDIX hydrolase [Candidatus Binatia bacterium]